LPKPEACPDEIYQLMLSTWEKEPNDRPNFRDLFEKLNILISSVSPQIEVKITETVEEQNSLPQIMYSVLSDLENCN
jgi:chromatin segregation and condensation protein Rec8/ScpA/Scc1 (kleisin family)